MLICCLAMVGGTMIVVASAPAGSSFADRFWLVLPLIGCAALHLIMHKMMGGCALTALGKNNKNGERSDV
ncbi:hypothetical protein [Roseibium sp.]|uniref:hypothetical protein n=1 Tax=Roseibium sp. TaxID=1936156 RepID=UPI003B51DA32